MDVYLLIIIFIVSPVNVYSYWSADSYWNDRYGSNGISYTTGKSLETNRNTFLSIKNGTTNKKV